MSSYGKSYGLRQHFGIVAVAVDYLPEYKAGATQNKILYLFFSKLFLRILLSFAASTAVVTIVPHQTAVFRHHNILVTESLDVYSPRQCLGMVANIEPLEVVARIFIFVSFGFANKGRNY